MKDRATYLVGYKYVIDKFTLPNFPIYCTSYVLESGSRRTVEHGRYLEEYYPKSYFPGDSVFDHLVFSLKYEGIDLLILKNVFKRIDPSELVSFIRLTPMGRHHRRLWYLYENLVGEQLDLPDLTRGNYVDLVDSKKFFTAKSIHIKRQRINDNLLGDFSFCPSIRRTKEIEGYLKADFGKQCQEIMDRYPPELIRDALAYLYTQETRSSFRIEQESLSGNKQERFMQLLREANAEDFLNKPALIELQKKSSRIRGFIGIAIGIRRNMWGHRLWAGTWFIWFLQNPPIWMS